MKPVNPGNHPNKSLNECNPISPLQQDIEKDPVPPFCGDQDPNLKNPERDLLAALIDASTKKVGIGKAANCDPIQSGSIMLDPANPNRQYIPRYSKAIDGCDEAMKDLFSNLIVLDDDGRPHPIPIIWASQERAIAWIVQDNARKDKSLVLDRIRLPMLSIWGGEFSMDPARYTYHMARYIPRDANGKPSAVINEGRHAKDTVFGFTRGLPVNRTFTLYAWTSFQADMNQIIEQVVKRSFPETNIRIRGVTWESTVKLESMSNNLNIEVGDKAKRVLKFQFNLSVQTYIPQDIARYKAVLQTSVDMFNSSELDEITEVYTRLEEKVDNT